MKTLKNLILGIFFGLFVAAPVLSIATPQVSPANAACTESFLGIPTWYRGLTAGAECTITSPDGSKGSLEKFVWTIVLNVIEMALIATAYIAGFFILYGGFQFIVGGSNPSMIEKARKTIMNAAIGLVISMGSIGITRIVFGIITSTVDANGIPQMTDAELLQNILNLVYFFAGAVSVIVIIVAVFMYTASSGDAGRVAKAKNLLTYSIVGVLIVIMAFTITNFVIGRFN